MTFYLKPSQIFQFVFIRCKHHTELALNYDFWNRKKMQVLQTNKKRKEKRKTEYYLLILTLHTTLWLCRDVTFAAKASDNPLILQAPVGGDRNERKGYERAE